MKTSKRRPYLVVEAGKERLINASSESHARRHLTAHIKVEVANRQDLIRLLPKVKLEDPDSPDGDTADHR